MGGGQRHAAELIDRFLAADKELQGVGVWRNAEQHGEARIVWPVLVEGELSPYAQYELKAYPRDRAAGFRIILNAPSAIWRIDFDREPYHANTLAGPRSRPHDLPYQVGPRHYHAWADNRYLAKGRVLPKELLNARDLPPRVRNFPDAQRWFCEKVRIRPAPNQVVDLPPSDVLL